MSAASHPDPSRGTVRFRDVTLVDGTGADGRPADVVVAAGRVVAIEAPSRSTGVGDGDRVVDGGGRMLTPGFVDAHSHADSAPFLDHVDDSKLSQGVTTEVVGNCGLSLAPAPEAFRAEVRSLTERIFPALPFDWTTYASLLARTDHLGRAVNTVPLVGHSTLRAAVLGGADRAPSDSELTSMQRQLTDALDAGAWGLSSGLIYPPGMYAAPDELVALARALPDDRIYTTHLRGEGRQLLASVDEALDLARRAGCRLQISHLKAAGRASWGTVPAALDRIDEAHADGVRVHHDMYPYLANSTMLASCLPPWFHAGGHAETLRRLGDPADLDRAERALEHDDGTWENWVAGSGWDQVLVASTSTHLDEGRTLEEAARRRGLNPFATLVALLKENDLAATMSVFAMSPDDVDAAVCHPRAIIGSDGLPPGTGGKPHPRLYGTFTRVLRDYVRDRALLTWPEAVAMMTSRPAQVFGLPDRGVVRPGAVADLVLLDPDSVADRATFTEPRRRSAGIDLVMIGGRVAYEDGAPTGVRAGRRLLPPTIRPAPEGTRPT